MLLQSLATQVAPRGAFRSKIDHDVTISLAYVPELMFVLCYLLRLSWISGSSVDAGIRVSILGF